MIPGAVPILGGVFKPAFAFRTSATTAKGSGNASLTFPSSIKAGDLLVYFAAGIGDNAPSGSGASDNSDFTAIAGSSLAPVDIPPDRFVNMGAAYKRAAASDAGRVFKGANFGNDSCIILFVFRPVATLFKSYTHGDVASQIRRDASPSSQTITGGTEPLIRFGFWVEIFNSVSPSMSPAADRVVSVNSSTHVFMRGAYKLYNKDAASVTVGISNRGFESGLASFYISGK